MLGDSLGVVIDAGSQNIKAGFAGESTPRATLPTTVGRFRHTGLMDGIPLVYCGKQAIKNRGICNLVWPVQDGLIKDWDEMEKLWHNVFYSELHIPPESTSVMHAVHPLMPIADQQKLTEIMFETFTIKGLYLAKSPTLSLFASGRTSGIVWENGYECSYVAPVFEGFHLKHSTIITPMTGKALTTRLQKLLFDLGYSFTTPIEIDILNQIKADVCYVAQDYETELAEVAGYKSNEVKYVLPDGQDIYLGKEQFQVAEAMFHPELTGCKSKSLIDSIIACIDLCDLDYRKMFYSNIVFSGGSTLFPGLVKRVKQDLSLKLKTNIKPVIDATDLRQYAAWAGGSMMASMSHLKGFWLTKQEYEDAGADQVVYKFY